MQGETINHDFFYSQTVVGVYRLTEKNDRKCENSTLSKVNPAETQM